MCKRLAILLLLFPALVIEAQSIRLTRYRAATALYLDAERLYNFNLYERHRFELGLTWVIPNESCPEAKYFLGQWTLKGYGAYGTGDKEFKLGGSAQLRLPTRSNVRLQMSAYKDLERAASRRLSSYRMLSRHDGSCLAAHVVEFFYGNDIFVGRDLKNAVRGCIDDHGAGLHVFLTEIFNDLCSAVWLVAEDPPACCL